MRCFFFYVLWWNKYALLSRNGLCREYALFWSCLDSNLTQISQIWHQGCQLCLLCGNTGCPVVVLLLNMKCVVTVAPYPWRYFGPLHLRQKEPLESKIEPLGNYMWIGAIKKLTLSDLGACFWPFLTSFFEDFFNIFLQTRISRESTSIVQDLKVILSAGKTLVCNGSHLTWSH